MKNSMESLNEKVALITGGSKGIGYGVAEAMMKKNMRVVITSRHQAAAETAAQRLNQLGTGQALGVAADVRDLA
ncbi:MAG: SDR family NAD(P)-dependent oxidoreductase, partial [Bacteroidota bacterium]